MSPGRRWALALVYLGLVHITSSFAPGPTGFIPLAGVDKLVHLCEFGALALVFWRPVRETAPPRHPELRVAAVLFLFVAVNGVSMNFINRSFHVGTPLGRTRRRTRWEPERPFSGFFTGKRPGFQGLPGFEEINMPDIREQLAEDMKTAMREKAADRLSTIRLMRSEILNKEKEKGDETSGEDILKLLQSMVKKREEAAEQFDKGERSELAAKERAEILVVQGYLPAQMDDDAVRLAAKAAIEETGAASIKEMGKVMGVLSKQLAGQATGARITQIVKELLSA